MRLVLDTNLVVSGFLWQGTPRQLLDLAIAGEIELFTSPPLLQELQGVLERKKFSGQLTKQALTSEALVLRYAAVAQLITPVAIDSSALRDPDDEQVLACALAARVDLIASGDQDLLAIESFRNIPFFLRRRQLPESSNQSSRARAAKKNQAPNNIKSVRPD